MHILFEAVVDPFVSATDEDESFVFGVGVGVFLGENFLTRGREENFEVGCVLPLRLCRFIVNKIPRRCGPFPFTKGGSDDGFYGVDDGLGFDEHSGSASVDLVVDLLMFVGAVLSRIDEVEGDQIFFLSFL